MPYSPARPACRNLDEIAVLVAGRLTKPGQYGRYVANCPVRVAPRTRLSSVRARPVRVASAIPNLAF